jgi:hypothetical protein
MTNCKICANLSEVFASATIRGKYQINYLACSSCGFIQTEDPYWLGEAYAEPINRWGLFVRLMRDLGYDFWRSDKHCPNLFAPDYEARLESAEPFALLTAFEVFEHLAQPMEEIQSMLQYSNNIFFSTFLQPVVRPNPADWWYYGLDHGQHVSLYTLSSLQVIAGKFNLHLSSDGFSFHLLSTKPVSPFLFKLATRHRVSRLLDGVYRRRSLQLADHARALQTPGSAGKK